MSNEILHYLLSDISSSVMTDVIVTRNMKRTKNVLFCGYYDLTAIPQRLFEIAMDAKNSSGIFLCVLGMNFDLWLKFAHLIYRWVRSDPRSVKARIEQGTIPDATTLATIHIYNVHIIIDQVGALNYHLIITSIN